MVVDQVGDVSVAEWQGVGVLPQRGGGVAVTETGLGLEDLASAHQEGGDAVAEPVQ